MVLLPMRQQRPLFAPSREHASWLPVTFRPVFVRALSGTRSVLVRLPFALCSRCVRTFSGSLCRVLFVRASLTQSTARRSSLVLPACVHSLAFSLPHTLAIDCNLIGEHARNRYENHSRLRLLSPLHCAVFSCSSGCILLCRMFFLGAAGCCCFLMSCSVRTSAASRTPEGTMCSGHFFPNRICDASFSPPRCTLLLLAAVRGTPIRVASLPLNACAFVSRQAPSSANFYLRTCCAGCVRAHDRRCSGACAAILFLTFAAASAVMPFRTPDTLRQARTSITAVPWA